MPTISWPPHLPTVTRCMAESITDAGIAPEAVDAVNAHAAATRVGDQVEYDALCRVFGSRIPPVTANKSIMGHAMGAASAVETVFALMGMRDSLLAPTLNLDLDPKIPLEKISDKAMKLDQEYVLKNAFGFGGCNACIILKNLV